jgi:hypothetical protein
MTFGKRIWEDYNKTTAFVWCKKNKISDSFFIGLGRWTIKESL